MNEKYYRYQMTFPIQSNKIHKSKSLKNIVHKCYNEYKIFSDIGDGMFCITNLDKNIEYKFKINNKKIKKITNKSINYNLQGGNDNVQEIKPQIKPQINMYSNNITQSSNIIQQQINEISNFDGDIDINENKSYEDYNVISTKLDFTNKGLNDISSKLNDTNQGINNLSSKILASSQSEQNIINEISKLKKEQIIKKDSNINININHESFDNSTLISGKDLFEDIDVFDANLRRLYAIKKLNNIDEKNENLCIII